MTDKELRTVNELYTRQKDLAEAIKALRTWEATGQLSARMTLGSTEGPTFYVPRLAMQALARTMEQFHAQEQDKFANFQPEPVEMIGR